MNKQITVDPRNEIMSSNKKKGAREWEKRDESQKHYATERSQTQKTTVHDSIYMKCFLKKKELTW